MKLSVSFIIFLVTLKGLSQTIQGVVQDSISGQPLVYANIVLNNTNKGTSTDEKGFFSFKDAVLSPNDSLLISHIGYLNKYVKVNDFSNTDNLKFKLKKEQTNLDEVILNVKKAKYSSTKSLSVKHKGLYASSEPFGKETITFIENEKNKKGKITNVELNFKANKRENIKTYKAYFRVKFYELDSITKAPGKLLSYDDIIIKPENKTQKVKVDLEDNFILFPKNGVFVGLEVIKPSSVTVNSSMYVVAPAITKSHTETPLSWYRYRGKNWFLNDRKSPFKKKFYTSNYVSIDVKYIK